jgi:hypothetical protein
MRALAGAWRLVSATYDRGDRVLAPYGERPDGHMILAPDGAMASQLTTPPAEPPFDVLPGFLGIWGRWAAEDDGATLRLEVDGSSLPTFRGSSLRRRVAWQDGRLELCAPGMVLGGTTYTYRSLWERVRRPLGPLERVCALAHARLAGAGQIVAVAQVRGPLTPARLAAGLAALAARHPLLRARVEDDERLALERPAAPEVVHEVAGARGVAADGAARGVGDGAAWAGWIEAALAEPVDAAAGLWRVRAIADGERTTLVFTLHHSGFDGATIAGLVGELLAWCEADLRGEAVAAPARALRPAIEALAPTPAPGPALDAAGAPAWPFAASAPVAARRPRNLHRAVPVAGLLARARREQATVGAALAAAMLRAGGGPALLSTVVDLRGRCDPPLPAGEPGCCITTVRTLHPAVDGEFWALARGCLASLRARLAVQAPLTAAGAEAFAARLDPATAGAATAFAFGPGLSNLGALPERAGGAFALERFAFATSRRAGWYPAFLHAASLGGRMELCLSFAEPLLDPAWAEAYFERVVGELAAAVTAG